MKNKRIRAVACTVSEASRASLSNKAQEAILPLTLGFSFSVCSLIGVKTCSCACPCRHRWLPQVQRHPCAEQHKHEKRIATCSTRDLREENLTQETLKSALLSSPTELDKSTCPPVSSQMGLGGEEVSTWSFQSLCGRRRKAEERLVAVISRV